MDGRVEGCGWKRLLHAGERGNSPNNIALTEWCKHNLARILLEIQNRLSYLLAYSLI